MNTEIFVVLAIFWIVSLIGACFIGLHHGYISGYKSGAKACDGWEDEAKWLRSQLKSYINEKKKKK